MRRFAALMCLLATATLLPVQAEAAKARFSRHSSATPAKSGSTLVVVPGVAGTTRAQASTVQPEHVPFPPATAQREAPAPQIVSANDDAKRPWCRTDAVVGGFCLMN